MGACSYTLTKPCNESSGLPYFTVDTQNEFRGNNKKVSYVRAVIINVGGTEFILGQGRTVQVRHFRETWSSFLKRKTGVWRIRISFIVNKLLCLSVYDQVNGTRVVLPVTSIEGVHIYLSGKFVVLETWFGLKVRFEGNHHADVTLPNSYSGLLCGMCGEETALSSAERR